MPRKVGIKSTEKKEELEEIKKKRGLKKRDFEDLEAKEEKSSIKKEPPKKKGKKNPIQLDYNESKPIVKILHRPLAEANVTEKNFPDVTKLHEHIAIGRMRGKELDTKEHISVPIYLVPDTSNPHLVERIRLGFKGKHPVSEPTQYTGSETTPKKGAKKSPAKDKKMMPWTVNVPIIYDNKRDDFICAALREVYNVCIAELEKSELWEAIGRPHLKPKNVSIPFKMPIVDLPEGSILRIKFVYNVFTRQKRFELFDMRTTVKKTKEGAVPKALPETIKDDNEMDGTFEVDDLFIRPVDQSWGFSLLWSAARVHSGSALEVRAAVVCFFLRPLGPLYWM
jgi:hypothetical protein